ncbi:MAG TPA: transglutaminase family protein, partial [Candidatus Nanopelagicales bacterium]|nr:transglutaminase family protein [Candidatus Nanopelagicales bacterium]
VNLPPSEGTREYQGLMETVFDAALHSGLHCEKFLIDGRQAGSGGGHHLTLGGPTPLQSPFLLRPDLLASLLGFVQHHPSLSYLFTGLFVGPTSQAPRVDEARHESLYELEIALARLHERRPDEPSWLADWLLRHLLVDVTGNTHRTEISIDKLFDPHTAHGRQGLVELRAFEMPPHHRMAVAQMILMRALVAAFAAEPYQAPLVRWGQALHDRFLLPYHLWRDFEDVLGFLARRGLPLPEEGYRPFVELRCPLAGTLQAGDVTIEVRNALEPWHVLGEELSGTGTARYVDSSMERIEVRARGLVPERHLVLVNGRALPLHPTHVAGEAVAGVRFRAWAPPHGLQPHLGIHHPIRIDVLDTWGRRSIGACAYHVWHPEGRAFAAAPLTRVEAAARRAQRFTIEGPAPSPVTAHPMEPHPDAPCTIDLRRFPMDRPMPRPEPDKENPSS